MGFSPVFQICLVVPDADQAARDWAAALKVPAPEVRTVFSGKIEHVSWGEPADYRDLRVALIPLGPWTLELLQPGPGPSPWRAFLDRHGPGVFHFCVDDTTLGLPLPPAYHVGTFEAGRYAYHDMLARLGVELSVRTMAPQTPVRHQVIFDLRWREGSDEARRFLADGARILSAIPGVTNFSARRQVSKKNDYTYCFSMDFDGAQAYQAYNGHPAHVAFVRDRWEAEVTRFLEIDTEGL
jgi:hypothetical protein